MGLSIGRKRRVAGAALLLAAVPCACGTDLDPPGRQVGARAVAPLAPPLPAASVTAEPASTADAGSPPAEDGEERDEPLDPDGPKLVAIAMETYVQARPSHRSTRLGYLRAGASLPRAAEPSGFDGCSGGWYRIAPRGYVCAGKSASLEAADPMAEAASPGPRRGDPYPLGPASVVGDGPAPRGHRHR